VSNIETIRQNIATFNVTSPVGAEVMEQLRGRRGSEGVIASDANSKLTEASEELGMSVAHRADKRSLAQREVRQGQSANIEALARIADYYDKLPDMPREAQLKSLLDKLTSFQQLLSGGGGSGAPTKEDVLAALQQFDGDVTHQFAGLQMAREHFEATGASAELLALLDEAAAEFEKPGIARDVRAGFASAEVAAKAAATLETDPATVREAYRAMLRESQNMGQLFDALSKFDMLKSFSEAIETFMTAAGRDLASTGPSTDPDFLHGLLTELGKLKKLQSAFEGSKELVRTTERLFAPSERGQLQTVDVASALLHFVSKAAANLGDARNLLALLKKASVASKLALANGYFNLHGEVPDDVMPSVTARQQQNSTLKQLLDELVAEEEREYDEARKSAKAAERGN
jgi:type III secretion system YopN/LcrE/InvE/MxiC family regulator